MVDLRGTSIVSLNWVRRGSSPLSVDTGGLVDVLARGAEGENSGTVDNSSGCGTLLSCAGPSLLRGKI